MQFDQVPTAPAPSREELLLIDRAWYGYIRRARRDGEILTECDKAASFVRGELIVLRSRNRILAVFRLVHRSLRRLERADWPDDLRDL
jgi:hypothetical protein